MNTSPGMTAPSMPGLSLVFADAITAHRISLLIGGPGHPLISDGPV